MTNASDISSYSGNKTDLFVSAGLTSVIVFFVVAGLVSYWNTRILQQNAQQIVHTHEVILDVNDVLSIMKDAETGQRGFLITGDEKYLEPYNAALANIDHALDNLARLTIDSADENARIPEMKKHIQAKLDELNETIVLRRTQGFDAARNVVVTDRGKNEMDALRHQIAEIQNVEISLRTRRLAEMESAYRISVTTGIAICLLGLILSGLIAYLIRRAALARQRQEWLQSGQVGLSVAILGEQRIEQVCANVLKHLAEYLGAPVGAFFVREGNRFLRASTYGMAKDADIFESFDLGESLLGQAAKDQKRFFVRDIPDGYLKVASALGASNPRHLVISPITVDGAVNGVFELGFVQAPSPLTLTLLDRVSETIAVAVRSANYRSSLQNLLEETQRQAEELQTQSEELRVNNEELEEQSRALKQSQSHLEQQQAELEQTNSQLEEQAQLLEAQRDDLSRSGETLQLKARELEQASRYKSDFLANMSHELRTPLNSSLILAKLLADNPKQNLSEEQVKFAETIYASGNDLLVLINDILDLSKIEGGHMEVHPAPIAIEQLGVNLNRIFDQVAQQKGLNVKIIQAADCPRMIESDSQKLEQILKNLLSNAIKFTEKGSVELRIDNAGHERISFAVTDTGIGIAPEQQHIIFEAFRQADGTINRKYGGTGLGLSISRELVRLLGGDIQLVSEAGRGSTFTVTIPQTYSAALVRPRQPLISEEAYPQNKHARTPALDGLPAAGIDDRQHLKAEHRLLLVVEDDSAFAQILYDLAHESGFQCLLATNAADASILAKQYVPSAILLDIGLPDHSGLSVLDQLKRDHRTRHIPIHVISASDYAHMALSLGAVGYMLKPVKRDQLMDVLKRLEQQLDKGVRRVLVVEDNTVQRESIIKLLASREVEAIGVGTASECLEQLKIHSFDCMVLDLSLPDASGYALLETLSQGEIYSFPPVIVYTGRDLSADQEQLLQRYSSSIIIKGAKSPERLLDEVSLFLHQVVSDLPPEKQRMLEKAGNRDAILEGRRILVVEDDVRNVYALTNIFEPLGVRVQIARNGREAIEALDKNMGNTATKIDLVLMDVMMPEMDGLTATCEIRKRAEWKKLPVIMLTAKAMKDDQERCLEAGANDYMAKPLDVDKLLSLVRVWMPR